jgi:hypothetical protein
MKPLFTVHAGEYLVGSEIERRYPKWKVWLPSKDTGVDLLVTNARSTKAVSLQVKYSKDFNPTHHSMLLQNKLRAGGWWRHQEKKIKDSPAIFWVFVLPSFLEKQTSFIIIQPNELLRRLRAIHGKDGKSIHSYFWVTKTDQCWETRGLNNPDQGLIALDRFRNKDRDFTSFLNKWDTIAKGLK